MHPQSTVDIALLLSVIGVLDRENDGDRWYE